VKKVAFLVEPDFKNLHYGVRNYFSTIKSIISKNFDTEYITYIILEGEILWYRLVFENVENEQEKKETQYISIKKKFSYLSYLKFMNKVGQTNVIFDCYFQFLGTSIDKQEYDICIITNPWLLDKRCDIRAKKIYGLVYDFIANFFVLTETNKPLEWANRHRIGYEIFNSTCDYIVGISEIVSKQYERIYQNVEKEKIFYFPPFPPSYYEGVKYEGETKENSIILAAPFDKRKGLKDIPLLINNISADLDCVYIFGQPRCSQKDFNKFFKEIDVKLIKYYPTISNEELIKLYKKSKFLLFPSIEEGLGLPLIEAQICGCRIVSTNKKPMNELGVIGSYYLETCKKGDKIENFNKKNMLNMLKDDDFDYKKLSDLAWEKFSFKNVLNVFLQNN
jgi:glycosyl transferase GT4 family